MTKQRRYTEARKERQRRAYAAFWTHQRKARVVADFAPQKVPPFAYLPLTTKQFIVEKFG